MPAYAVDTGTLISGRYRLEQRLGDDVGATTRWQATDELLHRRVEVRVLPSGAPQTEAVMAAARRAAQIADPRFVRILDGGEDGGHAWVVSEWVDARPLSDLLAGGALPPREARRIATVVADALTVAHGAGLSHRRLRPEHVLRADSGQVKVVGLEVNAAVLAAPEAHGTVTGCSARTDVPPGAAGAGPAGVSTAGADPAGAASAAAGAVAGNGAAPPSTPVGPDGAAADDTGSRADGHAAQPAGAGDPAAQDAAGIGAILYAALTARWPLGTDTPLPPAPFLDGYLCSPRQVRAGVPADLDDIACRALAASPRRNSTPLRTPAEVAAALAGGVNGASATTTALPATALDTDGDAPGRFAAPAEPSRAARAVRAVSGVVLAAGLALAAWQLLVAVVDRDEATVRRNRPAPPSTAAPLVPSGRELSIVRVTDFDPKPGNGEEHPEQLQYAVDKNPATAWHTMSYRNRPNLGGTKDGVGLLIDLGSPQRVTSVTLQLEGRGTAVELRAGGESPAKASDLPVVASERDAGPLVTMVIDGGTEVRFVLVWLTSLPSGDSDKEYRGGIAEVTVRG